MTTSLFGEDARGGNLLKTELREAEVRRKTLPRTLVNKLPAMHQGSLSGIMLVGGKAGKGGDIRNYHSLLIWRQGMTLQTCSLCVRPKARKMISCAVPAPIQLSSIRGLTNYRGARTSGHSDGRRSPTVTARYSVDKELRIP